MSHDLYNQWWITSKKQLENLIIRDRIAQMISKPIKDRNVASKLVSGLYARYSTAVKDLALCLDQTCLIQKRFTMKKLVDAAAVRLNELKEELTRIDMSEYHYIDGNLIELKFIPRDVEIVDCNLIFERDIQIEDLYTKIKNGEKIYEPPTPKFSIETQTELLNKSKTSFGETAVETEKAPPTEEEKAPAHEEERERKKPKMRRTPQKYVPPQIILTPEEIAALERAQVIRTAVIIIQSHERARQCRLYYNDLDMRRSLRQRATKGPPIPPDAPLEIQTEAATTMQKMWRGYADRNYLKSREVDRRLLIGMTEPSWRSTAEKDKVKKTEEDRRALRDQRIREYIQANQDEKERVLRVIAPGLMEDIGDEIREWFKFWYSSIKNFDKYPEPEDGGSILIVRGETMTPKEWLEEMERKRKEKMKKKDKGAEKALLAKKKKEEAERKKKEKEKKKREAAAAKKKKQGDFEFKFQNSVVDERFQEGFKEYREIWDKRPFSENTEQKHYMDMITEEKCYEMQLEVRPQVDELMRIELDLLNEALANDKRKGKKGKKGKGKKGKGKKKKGKKGKKKKDPTGHRTTEDLFQELVDNGIIHTYPEVHLNEYKGDFSYSNWDKRNLEFDPPATLGDVRQAVMLNCILPLGAESMVKPRSVLIAGHRQSGKHLLAHAVFNETRCVLFDVSAPILAGKYPGAKGMKMLLHLINKMSRILQPSIIFIDGGEKPFYKKVPKPEKRLEPKRLGKKLLKGIVKPITPEDKVLVLAITGQPFAAKAKQMNKAFEKIILIPRTDYGSLYMYWRELLMPFHGLDRNFNVSELATLSVNYPLPVIKEAVETVLTPSRLIQLKYKPLDAHELLGVMITSLGPVEEKEWKKFQKWFGKTPLAKKRGAYMRFAEEKRQAEAKAAEKAKAKAKK